MKGCGKSAPRLQQCGRHGKPHREQNQIGTTSCFGQQARFRVVVRVGCARRSVTNVPDEWPSIAVFKVRAFDLLGQNPAYRPSGILLDMIISISVGINGVIKLCAHHSF